MFNIFRDNSVSFFGGMAVGYNAYDLVMQSSNPKLAFTILMGVYAAVRLGDNRGTAFAGGFLAGSCVNVAKVMIMQTLNNNEPVENDHVNNNFTPS
ncbi:MAG: hypothetical protein GY782_01885 [Gammaproteobacteria bacterium]|nr:hypothetical protein [Gammaproteobacteria bacterium]